MATIVMLDCPNCGENGDPQLVEASSRQYQFGVAVECLECGTRGMVANAEDGDEMAVKLWNGMVGKQ